MTSHYVYILECSDQSYYIGVTVNLNHRIKEHNNSLCHYTKSRSPIKLVYSQKFKSKEKAAEAERKVKGWTRIKKEKLINKEWTIDV